MNLTKRSLTTSVGSEAAETAHSQPRRGRITPRRELDANANTAHCLDGDQLAHCATQKAACCSHTSRILDTLLSLFKHIATPLHADGCHRDGAGATQNRHPMRS